MTAPEVSISPVVLRKLFNDGNKEARQTLTKLTDHEKLENNVHSPKLKKQLQAVRMFDLWSKLYVKLSNLKIY